MYEPVQLGALFGEVQSSLVVSCRAEDCDELIELAEAHRLEATASGIVDGSSLRIAGCEVSVWDLREAYESGLPRALGAAALNV
jgi:hypothetical protein